MSLLPAAAILPPQMVRELYQHRPDRRGDGCVDSRQSSRLTDRNEGASQMVAMNAEWAEEYTYKASEGESTMTVHRDSTP